MRRLTAWGLLSALALGGCANGAPGPEPQGTVGAAAPSGLSANVNPETGSRASSGGSK